MTKELTPEEYKKVKIAQLRRLQRQYHQMDKEKKNQSIQDRANMGVHMMELQMRADRLENGGL